MAPTILLMLLAGFMGPAGSVPVVRAGTSDLDAAGPVGAAPTKKENMVRRELATAPHPRGHAALQVGARAELMKPPMPEADATALQQASNISKPDSQPVAYTWYLSGFETANIACGILVAVKTIHDMTPKTKADLVVVHTVEVPGPERFRRFGVKLIHVEHPKYQGKQQWVESFAKLRVAELFEYRRVVYFDVDTMVLGSLDNLFDVAPFPIEMAAPRAYWLDGPVVQSGGPMVIDPDKWYFSQHFNSVLNKYPVKDSLSVSETHFDSEMDWVNQEFRDSVDTLDGFYALLIGEWCSSDGIYQHWQHHFNQSSKWVMDHAPLVHFIADWKPWRWTSPESLHDKCPNAQPELLSVYQRWWNTRQDVC